MRDYRERYGMDIFAKLTAEEVEGVKGDVILVDGVRNPEELEYFRGRGWDVVVVATISSPKTRYERLRARGRIDDVKSYEEFIARDEREIGIGMDRVILYADYYIVNDRRDRSEIFEEAIRTIKEVLEEKKLG
jgi:dephospho-CoA kinase